MSNPSAIDYSQAEDLGISQQAYDEVLDIIGRIPTIDELSTLLAMWQATGGRQSLYAWLRGRPHATHRDDYIYGGTADHQNMREPRLIECRDIARKLSPFFPTEPHSIHLGAGVLLYMIGNISWEFAQGEYAQQYLHLADYQATTGIHEEDRAYIKLILDSLAQAGIVMQSLEVAQKGLFGSLLNLVAPRGYDILAPREVRLDAFLFGEEPGRHLAAIDEPQDDTFLLKIREAGLNCCFLGRTTKNRIVVDGFDFGSVAEYIGRQQTLEAKPQEV